MMFRNRFSHALGSVSAAGGVGAEAGFFQRRRSSSTQPPLAARGSATRTSSLGGTAAVVSRVRAASAAVVSGLRHARQKSWEKVRAGLRLGGASGGGGRGGAGRRSSSVITTCLGMVGDAASTESSSDKVSGFHAL